MTQHFTPGMILYMNAVARVITCLSPSLLPMASAKPIHIGTADSASQGYQFDLPQNVASDGLLCIFGSQPFVPISWMTHSPTEAELISLDAGFRMVGSGYRSLSLFSNPLKENRRSSTRKHVA